MSSVPSHVGILRNGPSAWNAWRQENPTAIPNLAGIALEASERQLGPTHGGPINLKAALLRDAELRFATLTTADLAAADLSGADLAHARLDHADLRGANLSASCLDYANLDGAELSGLSLRRASLRFTSLAAANLEAADLAGANLTHAGLSEANLRAANLRNARLDYADFAGADLSEANLRGANLQNAKNLTRSQLEQSLGDASTILPEHLQGSVAWSPARGETAPVAPMLAPSFVVRRAYEIPFLQATALDRGVRLDHGIRGGCVVAVRPERSKPSLEHRPRTLGAQDRPIAGIHGAADNRSTRRCASCARRRS